MTSNDDFERKVASILPPTKKISNKDFFQRNKKIIIGIVLILFVLYIIVTIYVHSSSLKLQNLDTNIYAFLVVSYQNLHQ